MKRISAYGLLLVGTLLLGDAAYEEHRGIAVTYGGPRRGFRRTITERSEDPQGFRNLMLFQWIRTSLVLCGGLIILRMSRRADRADPFSPDFAGNQALVELNRQLTKEQARRQRPLK